MSRPSGMFCDPRAIRMGCRMRPAPDSAPIHHPRERWERVLFGRVCENLTPAFGKGRSFYFRLRSALYALLGELGSLRARIQILYAQGLDRRALDLGPIFEEDASGHLVPCIRTRLCNEDMQSLMRRYPWMQHRDLVVGLAAWEKGYESGASLLHHSCNRLQRR